MNKLPPPPSCNQASLHGDSSYKDHNGLSHAYTVLCICSCTPRDRPPYPGIGHDSVAEPTRIHLLVDGIHIFLLLTGSVTPVRILYFSLVDRHMHVMINHVRGKEYELQ